MPELTQETLALQRAYAGHVLTMRGSLPNTENAGAPSDRVRELVLDGHDNGTVEAGNWLRLQDELQTPPVAAFVATLPMPMRVERTGTGAYRVSLQVPAGIPAGRGRVRVQWPTRTIEGSPELQLRRTPSDRPFELMSQYGRSGERVRVGRFESEPVEVEVGDERVPNDQFEVDGGVLWATVPDRASDWARIRVVTGDGQRHRSSGYFRQTF